MASAVSSAKPAAALPIPDGLATLLSSPKTPWQISPNLFERTRKLASSDATKPYVACPVSPSDPEYDFVVKYFLNQKPPGLGIQSIECIHNPVQTQVFEATLLSMEEGAKNFPPSWMNEEPKAERASTIARWKAQTLQFSPVKIESSDKTRMVVSAKVIPLWHGTPRDDAICSSGFTFFGKYKLATTQKGIDPSTDDGYFGSGVYFTDSAHYASMYSPTLLLNWVSMREPFPVVSDVRIPNVGSDMRGLRAKAAYKDYNCHFIPVTSVDPKDPQNMIYHPCHSTEQPDWDEFVVFQSAQTLPRFRVKLGVDFPAAPSTPSLSVTVKTLQGKILDLLDEDQIQQDEDLRILLSEKADALGLISDQSSPLSPQDLEFYNWIEQLINPAGKLRGHVKQKLVQKPISEKLEHKKPSPLSAAPSALSWTPSPSAIPSFAAPAKKEENKSPAPPHSMSLASAGHVSVNAVLTSADLKKMFPKLEVIDEAVWETHVDLTALGMSVKDASPIDANTISVLKALFASLQVEGDAGITLLTMPRGLTLNKLVKLAAFPKQGNEAKFRYIEEALKAFGNAPVDKTYRVAITNSVLKGSRRLPVDKQHELVKGMGCEMPGVLPAATLAILTYMSSRGASPIRLFSDKPCTYTWCAEKIGGRNLSVGGFNQAGLLVSDGRGDTFLTDQGIYGVGGMRKFTVVNLAATTSADLKKMFPKLEVLDEAVWETHANLDALGMSVKDASPINANTISVLKALFASLQVEGDAGITLLTMPRGLTLNKLMKLASFPKQGNAAKFAYVASEILKEFGDTAVDKTYRVAITNYVLKGSRGLSADRQHSLVMRMGCEVPGVLPAATLPILTYISSRASFFRSPTRLYGHKWGEYATFTRCTEKAGGIRPGSYNVIVGSFGPEGGNLSQRAGLNVGVDEFPMGDCGVGGLRKFIE